MPALHTTIPQITMDQLQWLAQAERYGTQSAAIQAAVDKLYMEVREMIDAIAVSGAWYTDDPGIVVVELEGGGLVQFDIAPFRNVARDELSGYDKTHPAKTGALPVPQYLYRFYGLRSCEQS